MYISLLGQTTRPIEAVRRGRATNSIVLNPKRGDKYIYVYIYVYKPLGSNTDNKLHKTPNPSLIS